MRSVLVAFTAPADAYAFLSEIRRRADSMLWDVVVRRPEDESVVVVPERIWRRDRFVRGIAERYGGAIRDDDRCEERPAERRASSG
jgi:hypothetical protein